MTRSLFCTQHESTLTPSHTIEGGVTTTALTVSLPVTDRLRHPSLEPEPAQCAPRRGRPEWIGPPPHRARPAGAADFTSGR
jgi:hypothetical protein